MIFDASCFILFPPVCYFECPYGKILIVLLNIDEGREKRDLKMKSGNFCDGF